MTPRGIRNNNPGNIRYVEGVTSTYQGCTGSDGAFCTFDTPVNGVRALGKLLLSYQQRHGIRTIRAAIERWAPPVENNTSAYITNVARLTGYSPDAPFDFSDFAVLRALTLAIICQENCEQPYTAETIDAGIAMALGTRAPNPGVPAPSVAEPTAEPPKKEVKMPIFAALLPTILQMIPGLIGIFGKSERAQQNAKAARVVSEAITTAAQQATEAAQPPNLQAAVEAMQSDPVIAAKVAQAVQSDPNVGALVEVGGGIEAARKAAADPGQLPFWRNPAFVVTILLLAPVYYTVWAVLERADLVSAEVRAGVVMSIISGVLSAIVGFWLGTSFGSARKTDIIAQQRAM